MASSQAVAASQAVARRRRRGRRSPWSYVRRRTGLCFRRRCMQWGRRRPWGCCSKPYRVGAVHGVAAGHGVVPRHPASRRWSWDRRRPRRRRSPLRRHGPLCRPGHGRRKPLRGHSKAWPQGMRSPQDTRALAIGCGHAPFELTIAELVVHLVQPLGSPQAMRSRQGMRSPQVAVTRWVGAKAGGEWVGG